MKCGWCHGLIESHPEWELKDCLAKVSEMYFNSLGIKQSDLEDRVKELEKQVNRVPGSIPGDYTWDELVGNDGKN